MVIDDRGAHQPHELVEALGSGALEYSVGGPAGPDTIDHFAPLLVLFKEAVDGFDVVLEVSVHGDGDVAPVPGGHQARQQRI